MDTPLLEKPTGDGNPTAGQHTDNRTIPNGTGSGNPLPKPDKDTNLHTLQVMFDPGNVVELRAFARGGKKRTDAGYFDGTHWDDMAAHAERLSLGGASVYVTLNPVDPQLLNRYCNRVEPYPSATTTDKQVMRRRWLLVDIDPTRLANTSASDAQVAQAQAKGQTVSQYLQALGWADPLMAESGNGFHLLYPIDLPNDSAAAALVKAVLAALAERFDDDVVKIDRSVFNAARICKLYGTIANKGDHTRLAPWRLSRLVATPKRSLVTVDQLLALAGEAKLMPQPDRTASPALPVAKRFDLGDFLSRHEIAYIRDIHEGRERFKLALCPFNLEHVNGEAAIFRDPSGKLGFKCMHDSCSDKTWRELRALLDGPNMTRSESFTAAVDGPAITMNCANADRSIATVWPNPAPLPDALPPVAAFDAEMLPEALRDWVADIAHRMQCPVDFPAVGAVVALSSLIGARAVVKPKARDDWSVVPNLWGLIVGRPGVMKSPALAQVLNPLHRLEATEREQWQKAHESWALDCKVAELAAKQNEKQAGNVAAKDPNKARALLQPVDTPAEPLARRYVVNDATVEKLGEILEANPWGTLSYRDEIHGLLCSMDRQGQEGARAFYLQAFDGNQGYVFDRIIRGTHYIPRVCLALLGGIQPGKVQSYVREAVAGGAGDDGLLQRFGLAVWPDITREWQRVDQWPDTPAKQASWAVFERLNLLQTASESDPQEWRFSPEAQDLYWQWAQPFETEIRGEELHPALISHLSKYRKLIPALALIFALVDTPDSGNVIQERELLRALAWCDYLRTHAERMYAAAVIPETTGAKQLLDKIRAGKWHDADGVLLEAFTPRLVAVKHWAGLATPEAVRKAADLLADYGWLVKEATPIGSMGGRPSERYLIHPVLLRGGA